MADNALDKLKKDKANAEQALQAAKLYQPYNKELISQKQSELDNITKEIESAGNTQGPKSAGNTQGPNSYYNDRGYPVSTDYKQPEKPKETPLKAVSNKQNTDTQKTETNNQSTQDNQNNTQESKDQINRNWYTDYYGNDIHKNGATPFNDGKKEEKPADDPNKQSKYTIDGNSPFWKDAIRAVRGAPTGNQHDVRANTNRNQAVNSENEAARADMERQWHEQNKNQNKWGEAGKARTQQNYEEGKEQVQKSSVLGGSATLQRGNAKSDINYWDQRQRDEALQAQARGDFADDSRNAAIVRRGSANEQNIMSRDMNEWNQEAWRLSQGKGGEEEKAAPQDNPKPEPEPEPTKTTGGLEITEPEPQPIVGNPHHVFNYVTYGNDPSSQNYNMKGMDENDRKLWEAWGSPQPLTAEEVQSVQGGFNGNLGQLQQVVRQVRPDFYGKYDEASGRNLDTSNQNNSMTQDQLNGMSTSVPGYACGTDNAKPGYAVVGENGPEVINMKGGEQVYPLDQFQALSDYRMKMIQSDIKNGGQLSPFELRWLARRMDNGHFNHNGTDYDMFGDDVDTNDQDLLNAYAKNIYNYAYNYKPEARNVDPSIDPSQEHIGPMAQDIEQVNPACVKETSEGVKTVDTARLAMMNAGVIADIARQLQDLTEKLKAIGVE